MVQVAALAVTRRAKRASSEPRLEVVSCSASAVAVPAAGVDDGEPPGQIGARLSHVSVASRLGFVPFR